MRQIIHKKKKEKRKESWQYNIIIYNKEARNKAYRKVNKTKKYVKKNPKVVKEGAIRNLSDMTFLWENKRTIKLYEIRKNRHIACLLMNFFVNGFSFGIRYIKN